MPGSTAWWQAVRAQRRTLPRPPRRRHLPFVAMAVAVLVAVGLGSVPSNADSVHLASTAAADAFDARDTRCPLAPHLRCTRLSVPALVGDPSTRMEIVFGVHQAARQAIGTLVIATGGPGSSGLALSQYYLDTLPAPVVERFDLVFFDPRGVGQSSALSCPVALAERPPLRGAATAAATAARDAARFARDCLVEAGLDQRQLAAYATDRVAEDLEAIRLVLGAPRLHLYGESYGTEVVQHYAARHGPHVAALILDAPVDTTLTGIELMEEQMRAFDDVLEATLAACSDDPACAEDVGADPTEVWDDLAKRLRAGPMAVRYPLADGMATRELRHGDLEQAAIGWSYSEADRMLLQRAVAAAARDDLLPLLRLAYVAHGVDPETESARPVSVFDLNPVAFEVVDCRNFADVAPDRDATELITASMERLEAAGSAVTTPILGSLTCLSGFSERGAIVERPAPWAGHHPVLVLTATADPATPTRWAERIVRATPGAHLVRTEGGSHVTLGTGWGCADDVVADLLVFGTLPDAPVTTCEGWVADAYAPWPLGGFGAQPDPVTALWAVESELWLMPEYVAWDGSVTDVPCNHGGTLTMRYRGRDHFNLDDCELIEDWPLTGSVSIDTEGRTNMELSAPNGSVTYTTGDDWTIRVHGTLDGEPIDEEW